jgi:hypothetical protein
MMKRIALFLLAAMVGMTIMAQTLNVEVGQVTYQIPASQAGEMTCQLDPVDGYVMTVLDKTFLLSSVTQMYVDRTEVTDNLVKVVYDGSKAAVFVPGNVAQYVTPTVSGAHVTIFQDNVDDVDGSEIGYQLSGITADGEFGLAGSYKSTISLADLTLTNPSGAAITITNKKRIQISAKNGTENTLTDCANGEQKGCIYSKGQIQLQGQGKLTVIGNTAHAIKCGDYVTVKNLTLNIQKAVKDGISCNKYFLMKSGTLTISGVGDDGIQCDLEEDDEQTAETDDHEDENSANIYLQGGTLTIGTTAAGSKGIKSAGDIFIDDSNGTNVITVTNSGAVDATDSSDLTASACVKSDGNITISAGSVRLTNTGQGGRALNSDGAMTFNGGTVMARAEGANYGSSGGGGPWGGSSSGSHKYAKGIKADGNIVITGGTITAYSKNHEGMESKGTITIDGGMVFAQASDDAVNSASDFTINGGHVCGYSTGNDGLDANGNFYIKGGTVYAIGKSQPELGIDANTEGGKKLYISGGTIVAIGGLESGASLTQSCYSTSSWNKNTWYALYSGNNQALIFKTPGSGGTQLVVSAPGTPTLKSGVSVSGGDNIFEGMAVVDATVTGGSGVSITSYTGGGGGPGGGPGGPGRWW